MDFRALLSRKIGGIPVLWILAVVALAAVWGAFRFVPRAEEPTDTTEEPEGDISNDDQPVFVIPKPPMTDDNTTDTPVEDSNALWARRAIEWLTAQGATLSLATSAITKYLNSEPLSYAEGMLRDKAVKQFGLPPEDIPNSPTSPYRGPASKQGEPPTTHTVRGKSDDTFSELARVYYGIANADAVNLINSKNPTLVQPFRTGARVRIPEYRNPKYFKATNAARTLYAIARKNGTTPQAVAELNPGMRFPVKVGTRVRVK